MVRVQRQQLYNDGQFSIEGFSSSYVVIRHKATRIVIHGPFRESAQSLVGDRKFVQSSSSSIRLIRTPFGYRENLSVIILDSFTADADNFSTDLAIPTAALVELEKWMMSVANASQ